MTIGSRADLRGMQAVGRVVADTLAYLSTEVRPGISTGELDELAASHLRRRGARSAPQLAYGFPGFICISVNDEVVHGVPGARRLLASDLVKIDVTAELDGYVADAARSIALPAAPSAARRLTHCARRAFRAGMGSAQAGGALRAIGGAIEHQTERCGFSVLRELSGHGVGRAIHEAPTVLNYEDVREERMLNEGLVLAVEPLISERRAQVVEQSDGWTLRTHNGALAAHYENTVVIQRGRPLILTAVA